jgi:hypothetical protein
MTKDRRCTAIKSDGTRCKTFAIRDGQGLCIFHDREAHLAAVENYHHRVLSDEEMALILSKQLRRLGHTAKHPLEKSREMRSLVELIAGLRGKKVEEVEHDEGLSLEQRIELAKAEHH